MIRLLLFFSPYFTIHQSSPKWCMHIYSTHLLYVLNKLCVRINYIQRSDVYIKESGRETREDGTGRVHENAERQCFSVDGNTRTWPCDLPTLFFLLFVISSLLFFFIFWPKNLPLNGIGRHRLLHPPKKRHYWFV